MTEEEFLWVIYMPKAQTPVDMNSSHRLPAVPRAPRLPQSLPCARRPVLGAASPRGAGDMEDVGDEEKRPTASALQGQPARSHPRCLPCGKGQAGVLSAPWGTHHWLAELGKEGRSLRGRGQRELQIHSP